MSVPKNVGAYQVLVCCDVFGSTLVSNSRAWHSRSDFMRNGITLSIGEKYLNARSLGVDA